MGIKSVPEGLSGQPDVSLVSLRDGQRLSWDATNSKWVNGKEFIPAPSITSPAADATITATVAASWTCSAFASAPNMNLVWFDNDWEMATNPSFDNVIYALYNQTGSATTVSATPPTGYPSAFIRVRQNTVDQKGVWSAPVRVIIAQLTYFNTSGNFLVPANTNSVTAHLVGGGSGAAQNVMGGGGGGGVTANSTVSVTPNATIAVTVGAGNTGTTAGGTSTFSTSNAAGGAGTATGNAGKASGNSVAGGSAGTASGGGGGGAANGGGAGGANGVNHAAGAGGAGAVMTVDGVQRGGGGGGGAPNSGNSLYGYNGGAAGAGGGGAGIGGGSSGSTPPSGAATIGGAGTAGRGGGGGGNFNASNGGSTGGNGIVILYYTF